MMIYWQTFFVIPIQKQGGQRKAEKQKLLQSLVLHPNAIATSSQSALEI